MQPAPKAAIVGGGWAGFAAAVALAQAGWQVALHEASRTPGGRARSLALAGAQGRSIAADNGQHILIGAYTECLRLMRTIGAQPDALLYRRPLALRHADGSGLAFPAWPAPLDALAGIAGARGWGRGERAALLARALRWRLRGFRCAPGATVADVCAGLPARLMDEFIEPLCVSALNLPSGQASGAVFLRVLQDALFAGSGGSHFLVPRAPLGALLPEPAAHWLRQRGHHVHCASRVQELAPLGPQWRLRSSAGLEERHDAVLLACPAQEAARLALTAAADASLPARHGVRYQRWAGLADALEHTAIATVYAQADPRAQRLPGELPWLALRCGPGWPAQFVFDRGRLNPGEPAQQGLLAFVVSHCTGDRATLEAQVLAQAAGQLGWHGLAPVQTVIDKRATFACTPALARPGPELGHGLWACGDYVQGPYPATLEGAVRSGLQAAQAIAASRA